MRTSNLPPAVKAALVRGARRASKAIAGALGSFTVGLGTAMVDGELTRPEVIAAAGFALTIGGGIVYVAPKNRG